MNGVFEDREMNCVDCGGPFTWTGGDQAFYTKQGFAEPKRCKPCREAKRAQYADKTAHPEDSRP